MFGDAGDTETVHDDFLRGLGIAILHRRHDVARRRWRRRDRRGVTRRRRCRGLVGECCIAGCLIWHNGAGVLCADDPASQCQRCCKVNNSHDTFPRTASISNNSGPRGIPRSRQLRNFNPIWSQAIAACSSTCYFSNNTPSNVKKNSYPAVAKASAGQPDSYAEARGIRYLSKQPSGQAEAAMTGIFHLTRNSQYPRKISATAPTRMASSGLQVIAGRIDSSVVNARPEAADDPSPIGAK